MAVELVWKTPRARIGAIVIDATISEEHSADAEVTSHPVEEGAPVSDHYRPTPDSLTLSGIVSNTPILEEDRNEVGDVPANTPGRAEEAFVQLRRLRDEKQVVDVLTGLHVYKSMMVKSLRFPRNAKTGEAVHFTATLVQIKRVQTQTVEIQKRTSTVRGTVKPPKNLGKQVTKPAVDAQKRQSLLDKWLSSATGLTKTAAPGGTPGT